MLSASGQGHCQCTGGCRRSSEKERLSSRLAFASSDVDRSFSFRNGTYPAWAGPWEVLEGARDNLPDQAALLAAQRIQAMISQTMCADDVLLVLISGNVCTQKTVGN